MRASQPVAHDMVVLCLKNVHCRPKEFFYADYMCIIFSRAATAKAINQKSNQIKSNMKRVAGFRQSMGRPLTRRVGQSLPSMQRR
jgi:hypothetical protein